MDIITFLIVFPFGVALILSVMKKHSPLRSVFIFSSCAAIIAAVLWYAVASLAGNRAHSFLVETRSLDMAITIGEFLMMALILYFSFRYRKYYVALLSVAQTGLIAWLELSGPHAVITAPHIYSDRLTVMMCLMIGVVGSLICVYAVGYMKRYHHHHAEYTDRSSFFFAMLFVFLGAMFGLVFSNNLTWLYFFWEITTLCSFLLIGYTRTGQATGNAFKALWMNLVGGLCFAVAIVYCVLVFHVADLQNLVGMGEAGTVVMIPLVLLAVAGMSKSAQLPFSGWLLGAMVAPTPTSALLHSATMVKAGVYLLIRLSPLFQGNLAGTMVTTIGGFTFFAASLLAISQSDAKKVLAWSTISNLGLITSCAGVGMHEAVWAGILLILFHAVSKSLMFLSVGAVENATGSRDIEDMHGLIVKLPGLAFVMIVGIAGMFLAPFGMLISKWAALKAFVDTNSMVLVVFLVFGSATTLFYWTKWLGKLVAVIHNSDRLRSKVGRSQWVSLATQAVLMIALCLAFPLLSTRLVEPFLAEMFHGTLPAIISAGNMHIMVMMLSTIVILPIAVRFLTFGKKQKIVLSYMGGANTGDDRNFTNSFGKNSSMYLANWYMEDWFGEKKILKPSLMLATGIILVLAGISIGGAL